MIDATTRFFATALIAMLALPVSSCFLDRGGLDSPTFTLTASVDRSNACADEPVTLMWDYSSSSSLCTLADPEADCAVPAVIEIEPGEHLPDPLPVEITGSQTFSAPETDVEYTVTGFRWLRVTGDRADRVDERSVRLRLNVIENQYLVGGNNRGTCIARDGTRSPGWLPGAWDRESLDIGENVVIQQFCNRSRAFPELRVEFRWDSSPPTSAVVPSGACLGIPRPPAFPDARVQRILMRPEDLDAALEGTECRMPRAGSLADYVPEPDRPPRDYHFELVVGC